jgi:hypothetical protein
MKATNIRSLVYAHLTQGDRHGVPIRSTKAFYQVGLVKTGWKDASSAIIASSMDMTGPQGTIVVQQLLSSKFLSGDPSAKASGRKERHEVRISIPYGRPF